MPTIRLRLADDLPLLIPAHTFRLAEEVCHGSNAQWPEARACLLYDLGDDAGLQSAFLKTSPEVVAEMVAGDPSFLGRVVEVKATTGRVWLLPQHGNGLVGLKPPSADELDELDARVAAAEAEASTLTGEAADRVKPRIESLQAAARNRRDFAEVRCKLNLLIPSRKGDRHFAYHLVQDGDEVAELLEPAPRRASVQANPVRDDRLSGRRKASKTSTTPAKMRSR